jgi:hypothetical protein
VKLLHCVSRSEYPCCVRTRRLLVVLAISIVLANGVVCAEQAEISSWFAVDSPIWEQTSDQFMRDHASDGFRWASAADRQAARSPNRQLRFCGMPVYETVARFADGRLAGLTVSLYNVADAGDIDQEALEGLAETSVARITKWLEAEPEKLQTAMRDRARLYLREWNTDRLRLGLLWSYTRKYSLGGKHYPYRSEYVTVRILPPNARATASISDDASTARETSPEELLSHVTRDEEGNVFIGQIPMVEQGDRGYCAVATAERVLRYYGMMVDQHELAQIAKSSAAEGTSFEQMLKALKSAGIRFGVRVRIHEEFKYEDFRRLLRQYNREAKKTDLREIKLDDRVINVADVYLQMDPDILRELRSSPRIDIKRFQRDIVSYIDQGIPLVWTLIVGKYPENPPIRGGGGHMRLIIGYNENTGKIIYTDSWGNGPEMKRMKVENAWAVTTGLFTMEPRFRRY